MNRKELDYVVDLVKRHEREIEAHRNLACSTSKLLDAVREKAEAEANELKAEVRDVRGWCEELEADAAQLRPKVKRLNDALTEKEQTIIARDAAVSAMAEECERLNAELAEAREQPVGLVWHRAVNADGSPNLPGPEVRFIVTTDTAGTCITGWSTFDDGSPTWFKAANKLYPGIDWWAEVNLPDGIGGGAA